MLPTLTNTFKFVCKENYSSSSFKEIDEMYSIVRECLLGSCYAIVVNEEILYNDYDKTHTSAHKILLEQVIREQFANTPGLLIQPNNNLNIKIYMFSVNSWYMQILYNNGFFKLLFFN